MLESWPRAKKQTGVDRGGPEEGTKASNQELKTRGFKMREVNVYLSIFFSLYCYILKKNIDVWTYSQRIMAKRLSQLLLINTETTSVCPN